ncbi:MAG TPA: DUF58 domain-containing protein [bacterium]|nr:DUF58 domain-containing protein [bacterium]
MILLTRRSLLLLAACGLLLLADAMVDGLGPLFFAVALVGLVAAITVDALRLRRLLGQVHVERRHPAGFGQFEENALAYRWQSLAPVGLALELKESGSDPHQTFDPWPLQWTAAANGEGEAHLHFTPLVRGKMRFPEFRVRATSPWGLVRLQRRIRQASEGMVVPSLGVIRDLNLWAKREELQQSGLRRLNLRQQGTHFKELRPYSPGDELRLIDWKATARRGQYVVRELEPDRSQSLMILLDTGRSMRTPVGEATRLDYALHAALVLAYVASQRGDLVGAAAFGSKLSFFAPPRSGQAQIKLLLEGLASLQAEAVEPDYRMALSTVASLVRKRTLMVLFTDVAGAALSQELFVGLRALRGHHLPFVVTLPDPRLEASLEEPPADEAELYKQGAIAEVLNERAEALRQLERAGGIVVDVPPERLGAAVVSEYVRIKARGLL